MQSFRALVKQQLKSFGVGITSSANLERLSERSKAYDDLALLQALPADHAAQLLQLLPKSKSQLRQDLFVLSELDFKRGGFFVEFGATNGIDLSNTHLLETAFGWTGLLAEPAHCWHAALARNRSSRIITECVWRDSNSTLTFNEVKGAEFSTIDTFSDGDHHRDSREQGRTYQVKTISMEDMLDSSNAPPVIDYLSIDTEGSEFEILRNFNFGKYRFRVITCEHNFTPAREAIHALLTGHGYLRKLENISRVDDWYVFPE